MTETRWQQRFQNYQSALAQLTTAVDLAKTRELSDLEKQGLIQAFEFTHELAWNVLKDFLVHQDNATLAGSRDTTREAFRLGLIEDGEVWMQMIQSRNQTSHTYNRATANEIVEKVRKSYFSCFKNSLQLLPLDFNHDRAIWTQCRGSQ